MERRKKMNKYQESLSYIIDNYIDMHYEGRPINEDTEHALCLQELVDKADSFKWIPVSERLPEEHDSIFAKLYGTDKWDDAFWRTKSKDVLVTIEYEDGTRIVKSSHTTDGKWFIEKKTTLSKFKVVAWMELPEPYKEKENDLSRNH